MRTETKKPGEAEPVAPCKDISEGTCCPVLPVEDPRSRAGCWECWLLGAVCPRGVSVCPPRAGTAAGLK